VRRKSFLKVKRGTSFRKGDYLLSLSNPKGMFEILNDSDGSDRYSQVYGRNIKTGKKEPFFLYTGIGNWYRIALDIERPVGTPEEMKHFFDSLFMKLR
jgi:hypothetical protein